MTNGMDGRTTWQDSVCDDIAPILLALKEQYRLDVWKFSADPQGQWARLYLRRNFTPGMIAYLQEQYANSPHLQFGMDYVRCMHHDCRIYSARAWRSDLRRRPKKRTWYGSLILLGGVILLIAGGVLELVNGIQNGDWARSALGIVSIIFFGFFAIMEIKDFMSLIRPK
jgi:hypothetical protein